MQAKRRALKRMMTWRWRHLETGEEKMPSRKGANGGKGADSREEGDDEGEGSTVGVGVRREGSDAADGKDLGGILLRPEERLDGGRGRGFKGVGIMEHVGLVEEDDGVGAKAFEDRGGEEVIKEEADGGKGASDREGGDGEGEGSVVKVGFRREGVGVADGKDPGGILLGPEEGEGLEGFRLSRGGGILL